MFERDISLEALRKEPVKYAAVKTSLFCGCKDCKELKLLLEGGSGPAAVVNSFFDRFAAKYYYDKMSLVIQEPGFVSSENFSKRTDGKASRILFSKAGRFSLVSIYKSIREDNSFESGIADKVIVRNIKEDADAKELLEKTFPFGMRTKTQFRRANPFWKELRKELLRSLKNVDVNTEKAEDKVEENTPEYLLKERYIPVMYVQNAYEVNCFYGLDKDRKIVKEDLPGMIINDKFILVDALTTIINNRSRTYSYKIKVLTALLDMEEEKIVADIESQTDSWQEFVTASDNAILEERVVKVLEELPSPKKFMTAANIDLNMNHASDFKVTSVIPGLFSVGYSERDFENEMNVGRTIEGSSFDVSVNFKDDPNIGMGAGGYTVVRPNDELTEFTLLFSAWCQRISSWSKKDLDIIDQKYGVWPYAEWLSGPYAEEHGLVQSKLDLVFSGNKNRGTKASALDKLRARMKA